MRKCILYLLLLFASATQAQELTITLKNRIITYYVDSIQKKNTSYKKIVLDFIPADTLLAGQQLVLKQPIYIYSNNGIERMSIACSNCTHAVTDKGMYVSQNNLLTSTGFNKDVRNWFREYEKNHAVKVPEPEEDPNTYTGTLPIYLVFNTKTGNPIKAYQEPIDYLHFMGVNKPYSEQDVKLYYKSIRDSTQWEPNTYMILDNVYRPEPLSDQYLAVDTIYVIMQGHFKLADRAYTSSRIKDCIKYAENFKLQYLKIPYYYRDKRSYERMYEIKRKRLQKR